MYKSEPCTDVAGRTSASAASRLCPRGQKWDGIYRARREGKDLIYAGKVDHGFDNKSAADLRKR
jgi:hypothetical protein